MVKRKLVHQLKHKQHQSNCMDDADLSQDRQEREDLIRSRYKLDLTIPTSNVCLNCLDSTVNGARWCSVGCRQDYENRTNKK
jgi:hypothetical protein